MPKKKSSPSSLTLASPSTRQPSTPANLRRAAAALDVPIAILSAVNQTEALLGGRQGLIAALSAADASTDVQALLWKIADPAHDHLSLATICARGNITPGDLFRALKEAAVARGQILGLVEVSNKAQQVAKEVAAAATEHEVTCPRCSGLKTEMWQGEDDRLPPRQITCTVCQGKGTRLVPASLDHQKLVFETLGLLKKSGGVNVQTNILNPASGGSASGGGMLGGSLEQLQQAVGELLFGRQAGPAPPSASASVEGILVPPEDPPR